LPVLSLFPRCSIFTEGFLSFSWISYRGLFQPELPASCYKLHLTLSFYRVRDLLELTVVLEAVIPCGHFRWKISARYFLQHFSVTAPPTVVRHRFCISDFLFPGLELSFSVILRTILSRVVTLASLHPSEPPTSHPLSYSLPLLSSPAQDAEVFFSVSLLFSPAEA